MDTVRLRVLFEDLHILSKPQKSEGLRRIWLLLKPQHQTISDLSSDLSQIFDLHRSCPHGIILSMDGFVLPPFESTCILKDKDVIRVKRKGPLSEIVKIGDGVDLTEEEEVVVREPVSVPLLENGGFEEEHGGCQSEHEENEGNLSEDALLMDNSSGKNAVSRKRKSSQKLQSSKKKRKRSVVSENIDNDFQTEKNEYCHIGGLNHGKRIDKKKKVSDAKNKAKRVHTSGIVETNNDTTEPLPSSKRFSELQENGKECINHTPDGSGKVPSRSARRKKAKRQWLRELAKSEKKELADFDQKLQQTQSPEEDTPIDSVGHQEQLENHQPQKQNDETDDDITADDDIVPIVIRPGHIRFGPFRKDQAVQQSQATMHVETFQWNGITNKRKGQKWGKENLPCSRRNHYNNSNKECSDVMSVEEVKLANDPLDFDRLSPFAGPPKEGDVIAYRLLELSSTWTPELSVFRAGKTSWYDHESNKVLLQPVPEYPISFEKEPDEDELTEQLENCLYGEDGSLEIDFSTLVDVRIVKHGKSYPSEAVTDRVTNGPLSNEVTASTVTDNNNDKQACDPNPAEKEVNAWEGIKEALSAKKAQLIEENVWSKNSSPSSWSYRALRHTALGPTMALLRARNDI